MLPIEKDTKYSKNHKVLNMIELYFIIDIDAITHALELKLLFTERIFNFRFNRSVPYNFIINTNLSHSPSIARGKNVNV